jgi:hypothetical protein
LIQAAAAAGVDMGHLAALLSAAAGGDVDRSAAPAAAAAEVASRVGQNDVMGLGLQGVHLVADSCKSSQQALPDLAIAGAAAAAGEPGFADLLLAAAAAASRPDEAGPNTGPAQWRDSGSGPGAGHAQYRSSAAVGSLSRGYGSPPAAAAADQFTLGRQRDIDMGGAAVSAAGQLDRGSSAAGVARVLGQSAPQQSPPRQLVQGVGGAQQGAVGGAQQSPVGGGH